MDWREIGKRLIFPPVWLMLILVVVSTAGLIYVFVKGLSGAMIAYPVYVVSFYTVSVITVFLAVVLPKIYKEIKQKIYANPIGYRYMTDAVFRTHISLYLSLAINLMFAAANVAFSAIYNTAWFAIFAGYYAILAVMRFILLKFMRKNSISNFILYFSNFYCM